MKGVRQPHIVTQFMPARILLVLTLVLSLIFAMQVQSVALRVEMKEGGACAGMKCVRGCCANMACCKVTEQQRTPQSPAPAPQHTDIQFATIGLRVFTILPIPPAPPRAFVILDETSTAHSLPPLAANCIRLI